MIKSDKIKLTDLIINTENYRFDVLTDQKEAIDKMLDDQGNKLVNLAEHILMHGLNPNDKIQVCPSYHDKSKFNVLEGNRRIIALKLLSNPSLIDEPKYTGLHKKFRNLHDDNKTKIIHEVECTIYMDPSEADTWIKLKHTGQSNGVGTVDWDAQQILRFEEKIEGRSSIALQTMKLLQKSPDVSDDLKNNLHKLPITSLNRLLSDPDVRNFLGLEIHKGIIQSHIDIKEVVKGITQIAKDLLDPNFNVRKIYTKDERNDYVQKFPKSSKPNLSQESSSLWPLASIPTTSTSAKKAEPHPILIPVDRKNLIPKTCRLKINNPKVNAIYHELQRIDIMKFTNAVAVLFRVFIELSLDCYLETNPLSSANKDSKLRVKVTEVANHLENIQPADKHIFKGIRSAVNNKNDLLGIETWNAYIHNPKFSPIGRNLNITWDNIQTFVEKLWANIK